MQLVQWLQQLDIGTHTTDWQRFNLGSVVDPLVVPTSGTAEEGVSRSDSPTVPNTVNLPDETMSHHMTFSGKEGEDLELYLRRCKYAWLGTNLPQLEKSEAIATAIIVGLRDAAARFLLAVEDEDKDDWEKLAEKLRTRFLKQKKEDRLQETVQRMFQLR